MFKLLITMGLSLAAYGAVARPGTVNYMEGQVTLNGQPMAGNSSDRSKSSPVRCSRLHKGAPRCC